ncbi:hypothetical protein Purlil1_3556 [Purpureocillium lilacinum]|uniref:Uncharacterized protein n=1 Tax=Purpureocillium lilacinum TaxID=33203 RepID=A0ABR0C8K5_PURLI|nr:hypothetical protein Purlil1_3556 [Purpureocillium lilacinum]
MARSLMPGVGGELLEACHGSSPSSHLRPCPCENDSTRLSHFVLAANDTRLPLLAAPSDTLPFIMIRSRHRSISPFSRARVVCTLGSLQLYARLLVALSSSAPLFAANPPAAFPPFVHSCLVAPTIPCPNARDRVRDRVRDSGRVKIAQNQVVCRSVSSVGAVLACSLACSLDRAPHRPQPKAFVSLSYKLQPFLPPPHPCARSVRTRGGTTPLTNSRGGAFPESFPPGS